VSLDNTLSSIEGKRLNNYSLHLDNVSSGRYIEETNFELLLREDASTTENPVVSGKYFSGRGKYYRPWLEIYYYPLLKLNSSNYVDLHKNGLDEKLFKHLTNLIPLGSHIMVVYINHEDTMKGLEQGIPPPATYIGYLLWRSGCTWFKDWYFAEGFWEGDVKLQGAKPLNEESRKRNITQIRRELTNFLEKEERKETIFQEARKRAETIIMDIEKLRTPFFSI
jgi:hypothetical protein